MMENAVFFNFLFEDVGVPEKVVVNMLFWSRFPSRESDELIEHDCGDGNQSSILEGGVESTGVPELVKARESWKYVTKPGK